MKRSVKSLQAISRFISCIDLFTIFLNKKKNHKKLLSIRAWASMLRDVAIIAFFVAVGMPIELYRNYQNYTFPK